MKTVSVITVNFNQSYITEQLLQSIAKTNSYPDIEIIVVDNGSKVNNIPEWIAQYPDIKFIRSDINLGFAGGNNIGVEQATGNYLFFVNNDTEFTPGLIQTLLNVLDENPKVGMVSPKIMYFDQPETLQYAGFTKMNYYTCRNYCIGQFETDKGQYDDKLGPTGYAHGAAMMIKREAMDKAGLMAENFFLYYEEMDWCDHIRAAGYNIWFVPQATIYHKESVSVGKASGLKEYFMNRNRILFYTPQRTFFAKDVFLYLLYSPGSAPNIISYYKNKHKGFTGLLLKAIWWNITEKKNSKNLGYPIPR